MSVKNNRSPFARIASLMLVLSLVLCCAVGGTMAKYISSSTGTDTATVAKWEITVNGDSITTADPLATKFDLFNTVYEIGTTTDDAEVQGTALIAPGTEGSFDMVVVNSSEVAAEYSINLKVDANASNIPLLFKIGADGEWTEDITSLNISKDALAMGATETVTVYWQWGFEDIHSAQTNAKDTALGIAAQTTAPTVTVSAELIAEQVD